MFITLYSKVEPLLTANERPYIYLPSPFTLHSQALSTKVGESLGTRLPLPSPQPFNPPWLRDYPQFCELSLYVPYSSLTSPDQLERLLFSLVTQDNLN